MMKRLFYLLIALLAYDSAFAQNVGIGTAAPFMKFHVSNFDSAVLLLENTQSLNTNISTSLYFKTGNGSFPYTGALKTIGTDIGTDSGARLGLFTGISSTPNGLIERLSITNYGSVGIGTTTPGAKLDVAGDVKVNGKISNVTDPVAAQDAATKHYVDQMAEILLDAGLNGVVIDIDGNLYKTIKIDTQIWMAQNLRTTRYNDGTIIPNVTNNAVWGSLTTPAYCWYGNDSTQHAKIYGALYNYYTVADTNSLNICPTGWHVPSDAEWTVLSNFLTANGYGFGGSGTDIGKSLASTFGWDINDGPGSIGDEQGSNNSSGFTALPGGVRLIDGPFFIFGDAGYWLSSTEFDATFNWNRQLYYNDYYINRYYYDKHYGFSVRCVRDE